MPKPFRVTDNMVEETKEALLEKVDKFLAELKTKNLVEGTIKFEQPYSYPTDAFERPEVEFSLEAWSKMAALIATTKTELAWYGVVDRVDESHFYVWDILIYPQVVTGATVDLDEGERSKWFADLPREIKSKLRLQGHSHVDFSPTPSGQDMSSRKDFLKYLEGDEYMIYIIMNKSNTFTIAIYDLLSNAVYKDNEIDVVVKVGNDNLLTWIENEKKEKIKTNTYTYGKTAGSAKSSKNNTINLPSSAAAGDAKTKVKESTTSSTKSKKPSKPIMKSQLMITSTDLVNMFKVGWMEADAIKELLVVEVNEGYIPNEKEDLLVEAEILKEELEAGAYDGAYDGYGAYGGYSTYDGYGRQWGY